MTMQTRIKNACCVLGVMSLVFAQTLTARADGAPADASPAASAPKSFASAWPVTQKPVSKITMNGVPNFGKLNDQIWRSGQPTRDGYQLLQKQGLKTVINLRQEFPQDKDLLPSGVRYIYIPIKDGTAPTDAQAKEYLDAASNPDNWPLLVHCHAGEGRAGVMSALVRCSLDKWEDSLIMEEVGHFRKSGLKSGQRSFLLHWEELASAGQK